MKGVLVLSAALLLAGAAHAQGAYSGSSITPLVINATPIQSCAKVSRGCNCMVVGARNEGPFEPSDFESFEQAVQEGEAALKASHPNIAEIAQRNREQKKAATQTATLVAAQDDRGRLVITSPKP